MAAIAALSDREPAAATPSDLRTSGLSRAGGQCLRGRQDRRRFNQMSDQEAVKDGPSAIKKVSRLWTSPGTGVGKSASRRCRRTALVRSDPHATAAPIADQGCPAPSGGSPGKRVRVRLRPSVSRGNPAGQLCQRPVGGSSPTAYWTRGDSRVVITSEGRTVSAGRIGDRPPVAFGVGNRAGS